MPEILLGTLAFVAVMFLGQLVSGADLRIFARRLRNLGCGVIAMAALGAAVMDRVGIAMVLSGLGWALFTGGRIFPTTWPKFHRRGAGDRVSRIQRTRWLEVETIPETGKMRGRVRSGRFAGQSLYAIDLSALESLLKDVDAQSARLLEAYIHWRRESGARRQTGSKAAGALSMSSTDAYAVLGLKPGASQEDVRTAHRRLMLQNHPDRGGSHYLAIKINQARDVLLG